MNSIQLRDLLPCLFLLCIIVTMTSARSWDLAVVIGREIDFFARNKTLIGQANIKEAVALTSVTYDDTTRTMYLSDTKNNVSIFSNDLTERNFTSTPLLQSTAENNTHVTGIVFDISSRTLFWADAWKEIIMKMHVPVKGRPENPVILHNLTGSNPRGIALDICNSHIYWVNSNVTNPSIERSNLDGSERIIIVRNNLYEPLAATIDHMDQKLYWIDDVEGISFKIERSNLDGSERELLVHKKHQQPVYLAVDSDSMYWSDWVHNAVWSMPKNAKADDSPTIFKSFHNSKGDENAAGIITRDNIGKIDCTAITVREKRINLTDKSSLSMSSLSATETFNNLVTSTEESNSTTENLRYYCLNDGRFNETDGTCRCARGFIGNFCEISLCYNYCLCGKCTINQHGLPQCECKDTFNGVRCEKDICDHYCLYDGRCSVQNGKPHCTCKYTRGTRCEETDDIIEICAMYCASDRAELPNINMTICRCTDINETIERISAFKNSFQYNTLLPIFTAVIVVLLLLIAALSLYVNKLRKRPRIKKRFVVSKNGVTPLTSRPQIPGNQCEITIENCCNMNICETPCFEPKLRTVMPRSHNTKKEEKSSLLDNMEGNSC